MPKQPPALERQAFVSHVAAEFRQLVADLAHDRGIRQPSQPAIGSLIDRVQSYVQTRVAGKAPLDTEIIDAYAELLDVDGDVLLTLLAKRVSGLTDAEVLDALSVREAPGGAYALAARRQVQMGSGRVGDGASDGGS